MPTIMRCLTAPRLFHPLLTLLLLLLPACSSYLANNIVRPPNHNLPASAMTDTSQCMMHFLGVDRELRVEVGPPHASLAAWIIEPRNSAGQTITSRGTILVLHGLNDGAFFMLGKAKHLSNHGYRTVVVSLRGYGRSSGQFRTFGVVEKQDLSQIIDALEQETPPNGPHGPTGPIGVWGMSYGAAMALELAGHDPRIKAVVAVAGFSSMNEIIPDAGRRLIPVIGWLTTDDQWREAIRLAGQRGNFNPDHASAKSAIAKTNAAVLIAHGKLDLIVPYENALRLINTPHAPTNPVPANANAYTAAPYTNPSPADPTPSRRQLLTLPLATHVTIWMDLDSTVAQAGLAWFDRWMIADDQNTRGAMR